MESKKYSWAWVTADRLLSHGACELLCAHLTADSAAAATATLYDGENALGTMIYRFRSNAGSPVHFNPKEPIYCRRGLYVNIVSNVRGIFVQWRELGQKEGG